MALSNLAVKVFIILRETFFGSNGNPVPFVLRDKKNTQDDPLDEYIARSLSAKLSDATCQKAPGPLITPDMVIFRGEECEKVPRLLLKTDLTRILGLEVKKLERMQSGQVARSTGLDYNTTPPCGTIRTYDVEDKALDVKGFYLFVCQERTQEDKFVLSALTLCDGNLLNADFDLYLQITGLRQKGVGLGTYGDGANRNRPMLIFSNPLGAAQLDHACSLITEDELVHPQTSLELVYQIGRTRPEGGQGLFFAYRLSQDVPTGWEVQQLIDPFPRPVNRIANTQARGKFRLPIKPSKETQSL